MKNTMKNTMKKTLLIALALVSLFACQEEALEVDDNQSEILLEETTLANTLSLDEESAYMSSLSQYDVRGLKREMEQLASLASSRPESENIWGIGLGDRIWKWTGTSWYQPNSAAKAKFVEVSKNNDGSVWAIGLGNHVSKWNGTYWFQPNTAARLYYISPLSSSLAFGIGNNGTLYITTNGGSTWALFTTFDRAHWISSGDFLHPLTVNKDNGKLYQFNVLTQAFEQLSTPNAYTRKHTTMTVDGGLWTIDWFSYRVYKSLDGTSFTQPNPAARLRQISSTQSQVAWGIDLNNRVYKTTNSGAWWFQPNSAARLKHISAVQ